MFIRPVVTPDTTTALKASWKRFDSTWIVEASSSASTIQVESNRFQEAFNAVVSRSPA